MVADVSEHLPLLYRVIGQMGLSANEVDEAYSEGLVALTQAGNTYDPSRGPLPHWLARNVRWNLLNWITSERRRQSHQFPIAPEAPLKALSRPEGFSLVIAQANAILSEEERLVTFALAWGYSGKEVARYLKRSPSYVTGVKQQARAKLRQISRD